MSEKILLVDDEPQFLEALSDRLDARGISVTAQTSAERALELAKDKAFDAIVLDLQMPGMDGIETLRELKKLRPELQVIFLTGHASVDKGIEAMKLGAMDFLEKPADIDALMEKIHKASARKMVLMEERCREKIQNLLAEKGW
ncbi:MAG: response regulator [Desulfovibrionaceae bacterium]